MAHLIRVAILVVSLKEGIDNGDSGRANDAAPSVTKALRGLQTLVSKRVDLKINTYKFEGGTPRADIEYNDPTVKGLANDVESLRNLLIRDRPWIRLSAGPSKDGRDNPLAPGARLTANFGQLIVCGLLAGGLAVVGTLAASLWHDLRRFLKFNEGLEEGANDESRM